MRLGNYKKALSNTTSKISADEDFKDSSRGDILAQIRSSKEWQTSNSSNSQKLGNNFTMVFARHAFKPLLASFLILSLISYSSVVTVQAAKASLPGDTLYQVKLGIEDVQVGLVFSEEKKAELEVEFAGNRLEEVQEIILLDQSKEETNQLISQAMERFNDDLGSVQDRLVKIEEEEASEETVLEISKLVNDKTNELTDNLLEIREKIVENESIVEVVEEPVAREPDVLEEEFIAEEFIAKEKIEDDSTTEDQAEEATEEPEDGTEELDQQEDVSDVYIEGADLGSQDSEDIAILETLDVALDIIDETNIKSLEVFVEQAADSDSEEVKQEAVEKIQDKIEKIEKDIVETEEKIESVTHASGAIGDEEIAVVPEDEESQEVDAEDLSQVEAAEDGEESSEAEALEPTEELSDELDTATEDELSANEESEAVPEVEEPMTIKDVIEDTQPKPQEAQDAIEEVKKFIDEQNTDNLDEAIAKILEAETIVNEADDAIEGVEAQIKEKSVQDGSASGGEGQEKSDQIESTEEGEVLGDQHEIIEETTKEDGLSNENSTEELDNGDIDTEEVSVKEGENVDA